MPPLGATSRPQPGSNSVKYIIIYYVNATLLVRRSVHKMGTSILHKLRRPLPERYINKGKSVLVTFRLPKRYRYNHNGLSLHVRSLLNLVYSKKLPHTTTGQIRK